MKIDYHIHSNFSFDVTDFSVEEYALRALELGLDEICFTDHIDYCPPPYQNYTFDQGAQAQEIGRINEKYPNISLKRGVEVGLSLDYLEENKRAIDFDYDFIIASQHIVDGYDIYLSPEYFDRGRDQAYYRYLENSLECLKVFDTWSVIGHIGYFSRFYKGENKKLTYLDASDVLDEMLSYAIHKGRGIELNSGAFALTGDFLPPKDIVLRYIELGGEIFTLGSDSHNPTRLYDKLDIAVDMLKALGANYICTFKKLTPVFHKI